MVTESSGIPSLGSTHPGAQKTLTSMRQHSSTHTETDLPVSKTQAASDAKNRPTSPVAQQQTVQSAPAKPAQNQPGSTASNSQTVNPSQQGKDQEEQGLLSTEELREMLDEINNALYSMGKALKFEIHDKTEDLIVRVINTQTDEVIRQYPSEEVLERRERLLQGETSAFSTRVD